MDDGARQKILERRARFIAATLAGIAPICGACASRPAGSETIAPTRIAVDPVDGGSARLPAEGDAGPEPELDSDGDSIADRDDPCPDVPGGIDGWGVQQGCPVVCLTVIQGPPQINEVIRFPRSKSSIDAAGATILSELAKVLHRNPDLFVEATGRIAPGESTRLAKARADAVVAELRRQGVPSDRVRAAAARDARAAGAPQVDFTVFEGALPARQDP